MTMAIPAAFWHPHRQTRLSSPSSKGMTKSFSEDIPSLRAALHAIDAKIQALREQRRFIAKKLSSAVAVQSPIHRLPDELLAKCFSTGVRDNVSPFTPFPSESEDPLYTTRILLVCKHWNRLACSTPVLWNTITISDSAVHSLAQAHQRTLRSKAVPLDVAISFSLRRDGSAAGEPIMRAMELLSLSIPRWRTFRMRVPNAVHAHTALKLCSKSRAPLLEAFSVQITNGLQESHYTSPPRNLFQGFTPRLRACYMTAFHYEWEQRLWEGLKVLKLDSYWNSHAPTGLQLRAILESCPSLEELYLRNMTDLDPDCDELATPKARPLPTLTLHRLHTVSFHYSGGLRASILLNSLGFPSLRNLEIAVLDNVTPILEALNRQAISAVTPMNLAIGLPLESLRIESCYFSELQFLSFLKHVPTIEKLQLVDLDDITSGTLSALCTPARGQIWIAPRLEELSLEGCSAASVDWNRLSRIVESRIPSETMNRRYSTRSHAPVKTAVLERGDYLGGDLGPPRRIRSLDLSKCGQFTRTQLQWLKMYVVEVRSDEEKTAWGS